MRTSHNGEIRMPTLTLLCHEENHRNGNEEFVRWRQADLSPTGYEQAQAASRILRQHACHFDVAFTSISKRAIRTLWIVLDTLDLMWIPYNISWGLNERDFRAPERSPRETTARLTSVESRLRSFWNDFVTPALRQNQRVLVTAHASVIRTIVYILNDGALGYSDAFTISPGIPLVYELDGDLVPSSVRFLDEGEISLDDLSNCVHGSDAGRRTVEGLFLVEGPRTR
jgi:2,3-bisphosphoglycerate-dependent phosphoglycerate mutase